MKINFTNFRKLLNIAILCAWLYPVNNAIEPPA
jgi:hypothetical protein